MVPGYLGKHGYVLVKKNYKEDILSKIKKELTVKPFVNPNYSFGDTGEFKVFCENQNKLYIPKFFGFNKFGIPTRIKLPFSTPTSLTFNGKLRDNQVEPVNACIKAFEKDGGGILPLPTGYGKTSIALYLSCILKVKTLIIVHKEFLMNQWIERILQFVPEARIGKIQQNIVDIQDKDIVLGMLQSISIKNYPDSTFDTFGFLVIDEAHHIGAEIFSRSLFKIGTKYKLGLSATPERKDGLTKIIKWHLGEIVFKIDKSKQNKNSNTQIQIYNYPILYDSDGTPQIGFNEILNFKDKPSIPTMITNTSKNYSRNCFIIDILLKLLDDSNRKILVLSERRNHLQLLQKLLHNSLPNESKVTTGLYMGGLNQEILNESVKADVMFGTYSMSSEGMDVPDLNTLILATSKSDIIQSIGRIMRKEHNKTPPLVIDIVDNFSFYINQSKRRSAYYRKCKYKINYFLVTKDNVIKKESIKKKETQELPEECLLE